MWHAVGPHGETRRRRGRAAVTNTGATQGVAAESGGGTRPSAGTTAVDAGGPRDGAARCDGGSGSGHDHRGDARGRRRVRWRDTTVGQVRRRWMPAGRAMGRHVATPVRGGGGRGAGGASGEGALRGSVNGAKGGSRSSPRRGPAPGGRGKRRIRQRWSSPGCRAGVPCRRGCR